MRLAEDPGSHYRGPPRPWEPNRHTDMPFPNRPHWNRPSFNTRPTRQSYNSISHSSRFLDFDVSSGSLASSEYFNAYTCLMAISNNGKCNGGIDSFFEFQKYFNHFILCFQPIQQRRTVSDSKAWNIFLSGLPRWISSVLGRDQYRFYNVSNRRTLLAIEDMVRYLFETRSGDDRVGAESDSRRDVTSSHVWQTDRGDAIVDIVKGEWTLKNGRLTRKADVKITPLNVIPRVPVPVTGPLPTPSSLPKSFASGRVGKIFSKSSIDRRRAELADDARRERIEVEELELPVPEVSVPGLSPHSSVPDLVSINDTSSDLDQSAITPTPASPSPPAMDIPVRDPAISASVQPGQRFERLLLHLSDLDVEHRFIYILIPHDTPLIRLPQDSIPLHGDLKDEVSSLKVSSNSQNISFLGIAPHFPSTNPQVRFVPDGRPLTNGAATGTVAY